MNFNANNLNVSTSPYLRQHQDNPINWQEYSLEVIEHARQNDRPLLISIGYATCHWCHVMAEDTFSNSEIADFMNENFVCIKVDREQRPDIDSYCMNFIQSNYGQGGWPLNVVMSPNLEPFFAATYLASTPRYNMSGFIEVMTQVLDFYQENKDGLTAFEPQSTMGEEHESPNWELYIQQFDLENGGFNSNTKFPPHCSLLFLLSSETAMANPQISSWAKQTLGVTQNSGLHDHVGGGFFRYCVDKKWEIPHFEKMLYDQAMMLISFSLGYAIFKDKSYLETISRLLFCLEDTFAIDHLYVSGHDADTSHEEGTTYLWNKDELRDILGEKFEIFSKAYGLIAFEGSHHLKSKELSTIAYELYEHRKTRDQPSVDSKILTSWNALLGVAFCFVERYTDLKTPVNGLYKSLLKQKSTRSTINGVSQDEFFLEDAASVLLLQTFMFESGLVSKDELLSQLDVVLSFQKDGKWIENPGSDFKDIQAQEFDHPSPSTLSIVEWALARYNIICSHEQTELKYKSPLNFDAHNFVAEFIVNHSHIKSTEKPAELPLLAIYEKSDEEVVCHKGSCAPIPKS